MIPQITNESALPMNIAPKEEVKSMTIPVEFPADIGSMTVD